LRGPGGLTLYPPASRFGLGFRTTCQFAGAWPWRGSKKDAGAKQGSLELGVPATVSPMGAGEWEEASSWRQ
jgi:hypothetical protein